MYILQHKSTDSASFGTKLQNCTYMNRYILAVCDENLFVLYAVAVDRESRGE